MEVLNIIEEDGDYSDSGVIAVGCSSDLAGVGDQPEYVL
jgi:hypothetical protein